MKRCLVDRVENDAIIPENVSMDQQQIELRIRTMRTLWIALMLSFGMYYVFTIVAERRGNTTPNNTLFLVMLAIGVITTLLSFPIKNRFLTKATDQQNVPLVQQGYVMAWALCEVSALLGMVDFFVTGNRYYYSLFILGACGQLLHFPRREHVINASFQSR